VITALACSLVGQEQSVRLVPQTRAAQLYGVETVVEPYYCNYGVNADYLPRLVDSGLRVSGVGEEGEVRIVELPDHPFFVATLFLPQARSTGRDPHPLLRGYAAALGGG
jgi:CTP synthase (UTP-ammonia lyase)